MKEREGRSSVGAQLRPSRLTRLDTTPSRWYPGHADASSREEYGNPDRKVALHDTAPWCSHHLGADCLPWELLSNGLRRPLRPYCPAVATVAGSRSEATDGEV